MTKPHFPQPPTANRLSPVPDPVLDAIRSLLDRQERVLVAIDGRCGAGKTTLAARLQAELPCRVFHMDDFFLQPYQRTPERLQAPGENVDHERFLQEVLLPPPGARPWFTGPISVPVRSWGRPFLSRRPG